MAIERRKQKEKSVWNRPKWNSVEAIPFLSPSIPNKYDYYHIIYMFCVHICAVHIISESFILNMYDRRAM